MKKSIFLLAAIVSHVFSNDMSVSKDSIKVYNNSVSSFKDGIIIKNNSKDTVSLDSAYLLFDVFDTTGMSMYLVNNRKFETYWIERNNGDFGWYLDKIGTNKYKLLKNFFSPSNKPIPLYCPPNDSCLFNGLEIGIFLVSEMPPVFPKYVKGYLELYLTHNEEIRIKIYSDNLGTSIVSERCNKRTIKTNPSSGYFTLNGKRIKNIYKKHYKINPVKLIQ